MKHSLLLLFALFSAFNSFSQETEDIVFDYYDQDFKPFDKGKWFTSLSFNLSDENSSNNNKLLEFDNIFTGSNFEYELKLKGGYFIGKYHMVGLGISRGKETDEIRGVLIGDTIQIREESFKTGISPYYRTYYPLSKNNRLSFFNEVRVDFGWGTTEEFTIQTDEDRDQFDSETFLFGIGLSPGINFFALQNFALEVQLDILGYEYMREKTTDSSGEETSVDTHNVNFTLNLLSLNLGLAYYFRAK